MENIIKYVRYIDYLGAIASIVWGISQHSLLWIGFGCVGLLFAWVSPAKRLNSYAQKKLLAKNKAPQARSVPADSSPVSHTPNRKSVSSSPYYGYRTDLPYSRGGKVFRFNGLDSFLPYALFIGNRFGKKRA
jgi:hypothetical protein